MKYLYGLVILLALAAFTVNPAGVPLEPLDPDRLVVFHNGPVLTMDPDRPTAEAIAVRGEKIAAVGSDEEILALAGPEAVVIDLAGRTLMPGFVDAHTHILNDARSQGMSLDEAQALALKNGITTIGDLYIDSAFLTQLQAFNDNGYLRIRTGLYLVATDPCGNQQGDWWRDHPPTRVSGEMLRINGVKVFTDGGSCGRVALSFELEPGWGLGDLWFAPEDLAALLAEVDAAGYQLAVHAIGDRAVTEALDALETVLAGRPNTLRHRMEHVSVIPPDQVARFGELGIVPVLMGEYPGCTPYGPPVPAAYGAWEWPWRNLRIANPGLPLAWHSDYPFQSINPFDHVLGFVTRIDHAGRAVCPPAEWLAENTLTLDETLQIMTMGSAYVLDRETEVGSLEPGKYADFIVIRNDPHTQAPEDLADNLVLLTVVGGRAEYCWPRDADLCPGFESRVPQPLPDYTPPIPVRWFAVVLVIALPFAVLFYRRQLVSAASWLRPVTGALAGLAFLAQFLNTDWEGNPLNALAFILGPVLAAAAAGLIYEAWSGKRLGKLGLGLVIAGGLILAEGGITSEWFHQDWGWLSFMLGLFLHSLGLILFGAANLRARIFRNFNGLPLLVGLLAFPIPILLSFVLPESSEMPFGILLASLGMGWVILGLLAYQRGDLRAAS